MSQSSNPLIPNAKRAYRAWYLDGLGPLQSLNRGYGYWQERRRVAYCHKFAYGASITHRAPGETCTCGIYAKYRLEPVWHEVTKREIAVFGAVDMTGVTLEHEKGVRAERAEIRGLWFSPFVPMTWRKTAAKYLQNYYNVPVFKSDEELLDVFPPDDDAPEPISENQRYAKMLSNVQKPGCPCSACSTEGSIVTTGGGGSFYVDPSGYASYYVGVGGGGIGFDPSGGTAYRTTTGPHYSINPTKIDKSEVTVDLTSRAPSLNDIVTQIKRVTE